MLGKNPKGKDCGKEISQQKGGKYTVCFAPQTGSRHRKQFERLFA